MRERERPFSEAEIRSFMFQMLQGLAHMHKNGYFHRDLKPGKVFNFNIIIYFSVSWFEISIRTSRHFCFCHFMLINPVFCFFLKRICWWQMMFLKLLTLDWREKFHQCLLILNMFLHVGEWSSTLVLWFIHLISEWTHNTTAISQLISILFRWYRMLFLCQLFARYRAPEVLLQSSVYTPAIGINYVLAHLRTSLILKVF